jgi:hypothetical protein
MEILELSVIVTGCDPAVFSVMLMAQLLVKHRLST